MNYIYYDFLHVWKLSHNLISLSSIKFSNSLQMAKLRLKNSQNNAQMLTGKFHQANEQTEMFHSYSLSSSWKPVPSFSLIGNLNSLERATSFSEKNAREYESW